MLAFPKKDYVKTLPGYENNNGSHGWKRSFKLKCLVFKGVN